MIYLKGIGIGIGLLVAWALAVVIVGLAIIYAPWLMVAGVVGAFIRLGILVAKELAA